MDDRSKIVLEITPRHASLGVACGLVYTSLVFLAGYFIGQRKAFGDVVRHIDADKAKVLGLVGENEDRFTGGYQLMNPSSSISLGYFSQPEQAHEVAQWANKIANLTFRVCREQGNTSDNNTEPVIYHVLSESCSNEDVLENALQKFAAFSDRSECRQLRLI